MNVTHLNCGSMREIPADGRPAARVVCHCLVVEAGHGLVLVETGFDAVRLDGLPDDVLLVPLAGHTPGHCAVAVRTADRWLLHAGDAYYYQGQVAPQRWSIPLWDAFEEITETDRPLRMGSLARPHELVRDHGDEVSVFSAHDPWRYAELTARIGA